VLPRKLYELLPFLYMFTGVVCAVLIDSTIVLISSILLIIAGVFVVLMRRNYRKSSNRSNDPLWAVNEPALDDGLERRSSNGRRQRKAIDLPALDEAGDRIFSDRRIGERRVPTV